MQQMGGGRKIASGMLLAVLSAWVWVQTSMGEETQPEARVDFQWIQRHENGTSRRPAVASYIPSENGRVIGRSGVTIASGFDLGQHDSAYMESLEVDESIKAKLVNSGFLGLRGEAAWKAHEELGPIRLEASQAEAIDSAVRRRELDALVRAFDRESKIGSFVQLDPGAQTVLFDMWWNYGGKMTRYQFWQQFTTGDWEKAAENLRTPSGWSNYRRYAWRMGERAALLEAAPRPILPAVLPDAAGKEMPPGIQVN